MHVMDTRDSDDNYGTAVGEWICDKAWPWIGKKIGWCFGKLLLGLLFGLGFWTAKVIADYSALYIMF